jgi:hypothetical protein
MASASTSIGSGAGEKKLIVGGPAAATWLLGVEMASASTSMGSGAGEKGSGADMASALAPATMASAAPSPPPPPPPPLPPPPPKPIPPIAALCAVSASKARVNKKTAPGINVFTFDTEVSLTDTAHSPAHATGERGEEAGRRETHFPVGARVVAERSGHVHHVVPAPVAADIPAAPAAATALVACCNCCWLQQPLHRALGGSLEMQ